MNARNILAETKALCYESFKECICVADAIPKVGNKDIVSLTGKWFLKTSGQLAEQIVDALVADNTLLALIGLRSLIEFQINSKYIFGRKIAKNEDWILKRCQELLEIANNPGARKNQLNQEGLARRAEVVGLKEMFDRKYNSLLNFAHPNFKTILTTQPRHETNFKCGACVDVLMVLHSIRMAIQAEFKIDGPTEHQCKLIPFKEKVLNWLDAKGEIKDDGPFPNVPGLMAIFLFALWGPALIMIFFR